MKKPVPGKPSTFVPGDKVLLPATVLHVHDRDGVEEISVTIEGYRGQAPITVPARIARKDPEGK